MHERHIRNLRGLEEVNNRPRVKNEPVLVEELRGLLVQEKFRKLRSWNESDGPIRYRREIDAHAFLRHDFTIQLVLPWVWQVFDLAGSTVVEVGSGTGSASAAFARYARAVHGYDILPSDLAIARRRCEIMGIENVEYYALDAEEMVPHLVDRWSNEKVDVLLLFAVLEHQTVAERLELLSSVRKIVRQGGIVVVCETPNRLSPFDYHSAILPYFSALPLELRQLWGQRSPREDFARMFEEERDLNRLQLRLTRFGDGVSYHEFELAFPEIHQSIIADGFHPNIKRIRGEKKEDDFVRMALECVAPEVHPTFALHYLDLVIRVD